MRSDLEIKVDEAKAEVQAWGACLPNDCDLGKMEATAYAPNVDSGVVETAQALTITRGDRIIILRSVGDDRLQAEVFTRFHDGSKRSDYVATFTFTRAGK